MLLSPVSSLVGVLLSPLPFPGGCAFLVCVVCLSLVCCCRLCHSLFFPCSSASLAFVFFVSCFCFCHPLWSFIDVVLSPLSSLVGVLLSPVWSLVGVLSFVFFVVILLSPRSVFVVLCRSWFVCCSRLGRSSLACCSRLRPPSALPLHRSLLVWRSPQAEAVTLRHCVSRDVGTRFIRGDTGLSLSNIGSGLPASKRPAAECEKKNRVGVVFSRSPFCQLSKRLQKTC